MTDKIKWNELTLTDGEGYELTKPQSIEALREFKRRDGMFQVFAWFGDREIESQSEINWSGFPVDLTAEDIETLGTMTTKDESGKHFTEIHAPEFLEKLEKGGWIEIIRPVHDQTGIPYSQEYWRLVITEKAEDLF